MTDSEAIPFDQSTWRVLVIEDNPNDLEIIRFDIQQAGVETPRILSVSSEAELHQVVDQGQVFADDIRRVLVIMDGDVNNAQGPVLLNFLATEVKKYPEVQLQAIGNSDSLTFEGIPNALKDHTLLEMYVQGMMNEDAWKPKS